jgi:hypothetical protein
MTATDPDSRQLIQAIAHAVTEAAAPTIALHVATHVAAMLREATAPPAAPQTVDAATLAAHLGVTRGFVYEHAEQLGGVRLGNGPRPRLRFDLNRALEAWNACSSRKGSQEQISPSHRRTRRQPRYRTGTGVELLPIRGESGPFQGTGA